MNEFPYVSDHIKRELRYYARTFESDYDFPPARTRSLFNDSVTKG